MESESFPDPMENPQTEVKQPKVYIVVPGVRPPVYSGEGDPAEDLRPVVVVNREDLPPGEIVAPEGIEVVIR